MNEWVVMVYSKAVKGYSCGTHRSTKVLMNISILRISLMIRQEPSKPKSKNVFFRLEIPSCAEIFKSANEVAADIIQRVAALLAIVKAEIILLSV